MIRFFPLCHLVQTGSDAHLASYAVGTGGSLPEVKRPGREFDHSHPSTAEVNAWSYTSIPPIRLHGMIIKQQIWLLDVGLI